MSGSVGGGVLGVFLGGQASWVWVALGLFGAIWCAFGSELSGKGVGMVFGTCSVWLAWTLLAFFLKKV